MLLETQALLGKPVMYFDYLGFMKYGRIVNVEPFPQSEDVVYVYIENENQDENIHDDLVHSDGSIQYYANICLSTDVILDTKKE